MGIVTMFWDEFAFPPPPRLPEEYHELEALLAPYITFPFSDDRATERVEFHLQAGEELILKRFVEEALTLQETITAWGGIRVSFRIAAQIGEPVKLGGEEPSS